MSVASTHARVARVLLSHRCAPGVGPSLPIGRLRQFAGFLTKVRHNALRGEVPRTLRLLQESGLEIEFFARYAKPFSELRAGNASKDARIAALVQALHDYPGRKRSMRLVRAVARHEHLCWSLARLPTPRVPRPGGPRFTLHPGMRLARYDFDPRKETSGARQAVTLAYRAVGAGKPPRVLPLTPVAVFLLGLIEPGKSAQELTADARLQVGALDRSEVHRFCREAERAGLIVRAPAKPRDARRPGR
jgi:hypothetical protein